MKKKQEFSDDIPMDEVNRVIEKKPVSKSPSEYASQDEKKPGFFAKLLDAFKKEDSEEDVDMSSHEAKIQEKEQERSGKPSPEVIEVLKISGKWLSKLDSETKQHFMESQDYAKYKFYLEKWGLTKKKE